ncbi:MAG TPA: TAXI family TRAP transporter solute-binding subunit, partial [Thermodesulfobacteriota bacterium]|nr:TAXI family TRAP transporter solute-binding subunit [Thermodesulfobacteriota bacterium]
MSQKESRIFIVIAVAALFLFASVYGGRAEAQTRRLSIGTADTGGVYYIYGGGIAKLISSNIPNTVATAEVTPGAVDNVKMLQNNSLDLAFTKSDIAAEGTKGIGPFASTGKVSVRVIANLYPDVAHVVVGANSGINKVEDMKGKRISTSAPGSGHEMVALKILETAGVDLKDLKRERVSLSESVNAFKDRKIDGFFFATGLPAASMLDLASTPGITYKLLDIQSYLKGITDKHGPIYIEATIPKGTYARLEQDVKTLAVPVILVTTEGMDEKLVYSITKLLFEKK